jgi:hypothetical protein
MRGFILHIILLFSLSAFAGEIEIYNEIYQNISIGETANAIKLCKKQIKKDKKNPTWPYLLGEAYLHQGDYALGIETLTKLAPSRDVVRLMKNCLVADSLTKHPSAYQLRYLGDSLNTIYNNIWPTLTPIEDVFFTTVVHNYQENIYYLHKFAHIKHLLILYLQIFRLHILNTSSYPKLLPKACVTCLLFRPIPNAFL